MENRDAELPERIAKGIRLLRETGGIGPEAVEGSVVVYNARFFLRRGDEVTADADIVAGARDHLTTRLVDGVELIDHETELGKRRPIPGVEKSLLGMRAGGFREVLVSPHLAYGEKGVPGRIPANAMLRIMLWLRDVRSE